jgi:hypothetical protein
MTLDDIKAQCLRFEPVGSRITCKPPPTDTDADYLLLVKPAEYRRFEKSLYQDGFRLDGSLVLATGCDEGDPDSFQSFKRGIDNLIVTGSEVFFNRFMAASSVAKHLNLLLKRDRIALFRAVLYAEPVSMTKLLAEEALP